MSLYSRFFKSLLDKLLAVCILILFSWLALLTAFALAISLKGNPFFVQMRPGYKGRPFNLIKFRTMSNERDTSGQLLPDHMRVSKIGQLVRGASLDEIPQMINILKGDMSFIGPRPLLMEYLPLYSEAEKHRHDVKPGVTGWAQVNGRNKLSWKQKFKLDLEYVEGLSLLFDIKIALLTVKKVLQRDGVNASTDVTMEKFNGSN